ncbi:MAG: Fur family transcriptional regulator [Hyphomicrobiales bacterium]
MTDQPALTRNQQLVFGALEGAEGPLGAYRILEELRPAGFRAPLQVYRALDRLVELGLVHRIESLNAFVACSAGHHHGHGEETVAFAICEACGHVTEFVDTEFERRLGVWCGRHAFRRGRTTLEIRGLCEGCAA